ncbi:MAG: prepilin-type N-terminal cleavage/methylation domain-containing protein [Candidatus Nealsonbacteria bacterium]|nr:prepilin-type N-terminal cleavage/methylation domain-containing protein [Candidatus Nealsonbacteria bacterium]
MNTKRGFTLIETTIATFILTVGILGVFALVQMITVFTSSISSQLRAVYLAQEGVENIRNIRDSNWLALAVWDQGIASSGWESIDKFQRQITIQKPQPDKMIVLVEVKWSKAGEPSQVTAETELYDWK